MEPPIITALVAGAGALAKGVIGEAGKDAYAALKAGLLQILQPDDLTKLEQDPGSKARRAVVAEELERAGKAEDPGMAKLASQLLKQIDSHSVTGITGVSRKDVEAANIRLARIQSAGKGVEITRTKAAGDVSIEDVAAGLPGGKS